MNKDNMNKISISLVSGLLLLASFAGCLGNNKSVESPGPPAIEKGLYIPEAVYNGEEIEIKYVTDGSTNLACRIKDPDYNEDYYNEDCDIEPIISTSGDFNVLSFKYQTLYLGKHECEIRHGNETIENLSFSVLPQTRERTKDLPDKWAVLVGMEDYPPAGSPEGSDLENFVMETKHIYEYLTTKYAFPKEHILWFTNETATHDAVLNGLKWLANNTSDNSTVVFSYNGHGGIAGAQNAQDSNICTFDEWTWCSEMKPIVQEIKHKKMLIVFDCCVAGAASGNDCGILNQNILNSLTGPGIVVVTASTQFTLGWMDPSTGWGLFGEAFWKEGLYKDKGDGANPLFTDNDGKASAEEAFWYAKIIIGTNQVYNTEAQPTMNDQYEGYLYLGD